jgi:hypothetical protein
MFIKGFNESLTMWKTQTARDTNVIVDIAQIIGEYRIATADGNMGTTRQISSWANGLKMRRQ